MNELWNTVSEISVAEHIGIYLLEMCMLPFVLEHFYKWLYWKTKWKHFRSGNWMCSPEETDAYCAAKDKQKQKKNKHNDFDGD